MRGWLLAILLVGPLFAGCIGAEDDDVQGVTDGFEVAWSEKALAFGYGHNHENRDHHRGLSTPNFELVGYDPLLSPYYGDRTAGAYFCGDAKRTEEGTAIAAVESRSDVGFALADVSDPAEPRWLGEFVTPTTHIYDLAVTPDVEHVVAVTSDVREEAVEEARTGGPDVTAPSAGSGLLWRPACASEPTPVPFQPGGQAANQEDPAPRPMSALLIDITDPSSPTIIDHQPLVGKGHSVYNTEIDGRTWSMVTTTRYPNPDALDPIYGTVNAVAQPHAVSVYEFFEIIGDASEARLELVSVWKQPPDDLSGPEAGAEGTEPLDLGPRGHDGYLGIHPVTGEMVAYLVGHERFTMLDMSDPANPSELGRWDERDHLPENACCHLHSVIPLPELWDGRHYSIIGPEFRGHPDNHPSGVIWVMDTTDPTDPEAVAGWTLPHEVLWNGTYMFSNHYYDVVDETLFVSMYHGGIWAVDLSPLKQAPPGDDLLLLESIGVYLPDQDPPEEAAYPERWAPTVEEALHIGDGVILTFDGNSGLYTIRFDAENPAPPPDPWPIG